MVNQNTVRRNPKIAVAQIRYYDLNKKHNVDKIKQYIKLAKRAKADIVCFPEVSVSKIGGMHFRHNYIKQIREECKLNQIWCIASDELKIGKKVYNVAFLIDRKGDIKGHYRKINLYHERLVPGKKIPVFETDFAKIGIVVCWDLAFPELFSKQQKVC